jgi:hypothetical protein
MSVSFLGDVKNSVVSGTSCSAVLTADIATNPTRSVYIGRGEGLVTLILTYGVIHADTTGVITIVESSTGTNGTWTAVTTNGASTVSIATADANTVDIVSFIATKPYVGVLVDLSGATLSASVHALFIRNLKQS